MPLFHLNTARTLFAHLGARSYSVHMPEKASTTHVLLENELIVYRRPRSRVWQCRYKVDGVWQRATTKQRDLGKGKAKAKELMLEAEIRRRSNLPFITRKFRHVAKLAIERMNTETAAGRGKVSFVDYERVINDYLIPYFGNHSITSVDYAALDEFGRWREEKMGNLCMQPRQVDGFLYRSTTCRADQS